MKHNFNCVQMLSKWCDTEIHLDNGSGLPYCGQNKNTKNKWTKLKTLPTCLKCALNQKDPELRNMILERNLRAPF